MLETTDHGPIRELRLARPPANALDSALLAALRTAVGQAVGDGCQAVVLSGSPGLFSAGLDVPALLQLGRTGIGQAWNAFFGLMRDIAAAPVPVVAALTGHSPAGGTVLAIFTDYRILAEGPFKIGLNEVQVGLPVPETLVRALRYLAGERQAERLAAGGLLVDGPEALRVGLIDELVPVAEVVPRALAWAKERLARPRGAMLATRKIARRPLVEAFDLLDAEAMEAITDAWFGPEAQTTLKALVARLGKST
jgi:3,2-trans-enoyl-CoA isomerase